MPEPLVSVIVVTWNRANDLLRCLASLDAVRAPDLEILVVDNGSRDGTVDRVRDLHPSVRLLAAPDNRGTSDTRNAAALLSRGEFLWFLDSDTALVDPRLPQSLVEAFRNDPGLGGIGGEAVLGDGDEIAGTKYLRLQPNGVTEGVVFDAPHGKVDVECLTTCNLIVPRRVFDEVGGFDNLFFFHLEDLDLTWRIRARGYRLEIWARVPVVHHFSEQARYPARFLPLRNRVFFMVKNMPVRKILVLPLLDIAYAAAPSRLARFLDRARVHGRGARAAVVDTAGAPVTLRGLREAAARAMWLLASLPVSWFLAIPHIHRALASRRRGGGTLGETGLDAWRRLEPERGLSSEPQARGAASGSGS